MQIRNAPAILLTILLLNAQSARFEEAKRVGMGYILAEKFDRGAGRLEEIWEQDQSDTAVGEYLAMAYLNTEDKRSLPKTETVAYAIINRLVASGSQVSFLVLHSHEKLGLISGRELNQYCRGRLSIRNHRISYVADKGEKASQHSFEGMDSDGLKEPVLNKDDSRGTFQLKTKSSGNLFLATRNRNKNEAKFIVELIHKEVASR